MRQNALPENSALAVARAAFRRRMNPMHEIEPFLLLARDWVRSDVICERFGIADARALRGIGREPGLVSNFAISSDAGYKHIEHATTGEWLRFQWRIVHHAIAELRRWRRLKKRRQLVLAKRAAAPTERDTGQTLLWAPQCAEPQTHSES